MLGTYPRTYSFTFNILTNLSCSISTQNGSIYIYNMNPSAGLELVNTIPNGHVLHGANMPVWIVAYDIHSKSRLISGGDDCKFKLWDLRASVGTQLSLLLT